MNDALRGVEGGGRCEGGGGADRDLLQMETGSRTLVSLRKAAFAHKPFKPSPMHAPPPLPSHIP